MQKHTACAWKRQKGSEKFWDTIIYYYICADSSHFTIISRYDQIYRINLIRGSGFRVAMRSHSTAWGETSQVGMYRVPTVEGGAFTKIAALKSPIQSGYDDGDGTFYGFSLDQLYGIYLCIMDEYSLPSWEHVRDHMSSGKYFGTAIALDPTSGKVYGSYLLRDDENVTVAAVDGRVLYVGQGDARIAVPEGLLLVTVGNRTFKVLVK